MRVLVTGAAGQVGTELVELLAVGPQHDVLALGRADLDISDRERTLQVTGEWAPEVIINAAAFAAVDACESEIDTAFRVNAIGPRNLAEGARLVGSHLVHISTDYVFDGFSPSPYLEWDPTNPPSVYGRSKLAGEREVLTLLPGATVVRSSWIFGRYGTNIVKTILRLASGEAPLRFVEDQRGCPTSAADLATMLVHLAVTARSWLVPRNQPGANFVVRLRQGRPGRRWLRPGAGTARKNGRTRPATSGPTTG